MAYCLSSSDIKDKEALNHLQAKEPVFLETRGKTIGVIISTEEFEILKKEINRREDEEDLSEGLKELEKIESGKVKTVSLEEIKQKIARKRK